jgi:acetyl esterase
MATQAGADENLFARPWNLLEMTAVEARAARAHAADSAELPAEEVGSVEDITIPGPAGPIPARIYRSKGTSLGDPRPILLWLHGGGMVLGANYVQSDRPIRRIVSRVDCLAVAVDFRLAPEDPYPAGIDDCTAALRWVVDHGREIGGDPSRIAIEGDSGGGLPAASCALFARDHGIALSHLLLIYPNLDCSMASPTWDSHAHTSLNRTSMRWFLDKYLLEGVDPLDPAVSPGRAADLSGLPSTTIIIAGKDPLLGEARDFGERLAATGADVDIREWDEMPHGFYVMSALYPEAMAATEHAAARLRHAFRR